MNTESKIWLALILTSLSLNVFAAELCTDAESENTSVRYSTPDSDFSIHDDGTVTHLPTGLMWMRCSLGQTWDGESCSGGFPEDFNWQNALAQTGSSYAGYTDWRLPNKNELASIVERRYCYPSINRDVYPNTPSGGFFESWYWSSSPGAEIGFTAWGVYFGDGIVKVDGKSSRGYVRLVRTAQ